ncbi:2-oxoacid:acceptor oxidoreductase family protein [Candidatus Woesearchaeota archaeon]|nr:2-oxoacid:acceptor oxidoreductase family protein [Candidatus Woesearchaeota archaeon]
MIEIRIHGRGGQGAKTAANFLAMAALEQGKFVQSFPEYGPERAGAPMKAYTRISEEIINTYAPVVNPDFVLVIDPTFIGTIDVADGLKEKGILIVNTKETPDEVKKKTGFDGEVHCVDASGISIAATGINKPNVPMLGALIKVTNIVSVESIEHLIKKKFLEKLGEQKTQATIDAIQRAHDEVK